MGVLDTDIDWTEAQKDVIKHKEGPIQVVACAGSGKTLTISARIVKLIEDGVDRDNILAFTFVENAAEELKVKIRERMRKAELDNQKLGDMFVDTIHSFAQDILHEYCPATLSYDVMDDNELPAFIAQHYFEIGLHELPPKHPDAKFEKIDAFIEDINTIRREMIVEEVRNSDREVTKKFMEIYNNFQDLMKEYHFFDHQELLYRAVNLLENNQEVLEELREQYPYIIVDEYQDTNKIQERLIELLAGEQKNLCVVGDDDQSIYKWRGAKPQIFLDFEDKYNAKKVVLDENFRSTELIVDLAEGVIKKNNNRIDKPMNTDRDYENGDVHQIYFKDERSETEFIADRIEELVGTVYKDPDGNEQTLRYGDIGILFRMKKHMDAVQEELEDRDINYTIRGQKNIFSHTITRFIRLAFGYVARGENDNLEIIDLSEVKHPAYDDIVRMTVEKDDLREVINSSDFLNPKEDKIIEKLDEMKEWYSNPTSRRIKPQKELQKILSAIGLDQDDNIDDVNSEVLPETVMYNIGQVSELIKNFEAVHQIIFPDQITEVLEFFDYAHYFGKSEIEDPTLVNAVDLLTIHSAKGLEYPCVFVPSLTKKKFPDHPNIPRGFKRDKEYIPQSVFDYENYKEQEEELRRLFYVAITRSQKFLSLTGSIKNRGYKNNHNPSTYFQDIEELEHKGVINEPHDDTPREERDISSNIEGYVYPTSFSDLRYYQKCPYDYKLRMIYNFAPPITPALGYGFAIHDILREMHQRHEEKKRKMPITPGEIENRVEDKDRFHLRYTGGKGEIDENLREAAKKSLKNYANSYRKELQNTYKAEVPFEILIRSEETEGTALVSGAIDLLERRDPQTNELVQVDIIDFKTGDQPDYESEEMRDNKLQVRLYGLATRTELDPETGKGFIHYLDPEDGGREPVDLSDAKIDQVKKLVKDNVEKIMKRKFFAVPEEEKCKGCDFKLICPHKKG